MKEFLDQVAGDLGFSAYGITSGHPLDTTILGQKIQNQQITKFESTDLDSRTDPGIHLDGARTIFVFLMSYLWEDKYIKDHKGPKNQARTYPISRYTRGLDYHQVMGNKISKFDEVLRQSYDFKSKIQVDAGDLTEKALAVRANLGSFGKNTLVINEDLGTYFFIGLLVTDLELDETLYDHNDQTDPCGSCTICIDACPTSALLGDRTMDPTRCLSYLSQIKDQKPATKDLRLAYGCDICQEACPHNKGVRTNVHEEFRPRITGLDENVKSMSNRQFKKTYKDHALSWTPRSVIARNMEVLDG